MIPDWFTSDLHFGHANVTGYSNRPFDVQEMNRESRYAVMELVREAFA